jgi:DNA polymerase III epsilon subunit-like protein
MKLPDVLSIAPVEMTSLENLAVWARQPNPDPRLRLCTSLHTKLITALHHEYLRYGVHEQHHEAGYDAFLTAQVFLSLAAEMSARGKGSVEETWLISQNGIPSCVNIHFQESKGRRLIGLSLGSNHSEEESLRIGRES